MPSANSRRSIYGKSKFQMLTFEAERLGKHSFLVVSDEAGLSKSLSKENEKRCEGKEKRSTNNKGFRDAKNEDHMQK